MMEQAEVISPQAGPGEVENHALSDINMRRATQLIGRQLAQIGDELNSRWREKLPQQGLLNRQVSPNILIVRAINRRIVGSLQWSKILPMVRASRVVPELQTQACQAAMEWIDWVRPHFPDLSRRTKCLLASAALLVATVFAVTKG